MERKYTIKDIAQLAGVSKGTVDRVLHARGKVSGEAHAKIEQVLKKIDYKPNPIALNLKNNKIYRIIVLLPDPQFDAYWKPAEEGIDDAIEKFEPFGLTVIKFFYDTRKFNSFLRQSEKAIDLAPDAIVLAPVFHKESLQLFKQCKQRKIKLALFNNYIDVFNTENFIGQDLNQSGRVGASLIDKLNSKNATVVILHINEEAHMRFKENGFKEFFEDKKETKHTIITYSISYNDPVVFKENIVDFFNKHPSISAVFVTNSKAHILIDCIGELSKTITIVGYDLLNENIKCLKKGRLDFLIHQKPRQQAYRAVSNLAEHFLFNKPIPAQQLLPIDIITSENVLYYTQSGHYSALTDLQR